MFRALVRAVLLIIVLVAVGAFLLGWWGSGRARPVDAPRDTVGTTGVDKERAREVGAEVGERTAAAAEQARRAVADGSITAKIKAKMTLDDTVKAMSVDVDTNGSTVTITGVAATPAQKERLLQLARETEGVSRVIDKVEIANR